MDFVCPIFDLYSDFLLVNQAQPTATRLAELVEGNLSHDAITRSLSQQDYGSRQLWQTVKPFVQQIAHSDGVLIFDDTVEEKPYMATNPLIRYHYDHCQRRSVKGINQLTALYHSQGSSLPVAYQLIEKDQQKTDAQTGKVRWYSTTSKHQRLRQMVRQCVANKLVFKYILADVWYSCAETFIDLHQQHLHFIMPLKSNRKVALSEADHHQRRYQPIESLALEESPLLTVWLEGVAFPLHLTRQVFKEGDCVQGELYLVTNDLTADSVCIQTHYALRWKIEEFYKSVKSNTGYGASPAHTVRTQSNHLFLVMLAYVKWEALRLSTAKNHFALKRLLTLNATKVALRELNSLKSRSTLLSKAA